MQEMSYDIQCVFCHARESTVLRAGADIETYLEMIGWRALEVDDEMALDGGEAPVLVLGECPQCAAEDEE